MALIPQCVATERPDRAASFLAEGQIVVLTDGLALALAPSTLWHQPTRRMTPPCAGSAARFCSIVRFHRHAGSTCFLPGAHRCLRFYTELISPILLAGVYETSSRVRPRADSLEALR